jgi:hypothetical protein
MSVDFAGAACADLIEAGAAAPLPERCNEPLVRERMQEVLRNRKDRAAKGGPTAGEVADDAEEAAEAIAD